ncbi:hypothetical protein C8Q80DRAFT_1145541 [Daedaleopsis nitida]|nr:hypothetical protein C8Q80DRAFT_1145541 [Daedaleopsis nitida]
MGRRILHSQTSASEGPRLRRHSSLERPHARAALSHTSRLTPRPHVHDHIHVRTASVVPILPRAMLSQHSP